MSNEYLCERYTKQDEYNNNGGRILKRFETKNFGLLVLGHSYCTVKNLLSF